MSIVADEAQPLRPVTPSLRVPRGAWVRLTVACLSVPLLEVMLLTWFDAAAWWLSLMGGALLAIVLAALDAHDRGDLRRWKDIGRFLF